MKLPNAERAIVDLAKLVDYCLNLDHPRGRHKARVFIRVLGFRAAEASYFREAILSAVLTEDAIPTEAERYGQRFVVDLNITGPAGQAMVRSSWIVRSNEEVPRLTSCYVI